MERSNPPRFQGEDMDVHPEVLSYVYQTLMEFEPYTTETTEVSVIAKDPLKMERTGELLHVPREELKGMYRINIALSDQGTRIEAEGVDKDIYAAIRIAKEHLLKELQRIHDTVVTNAERQSQIQSAKKGMVH